jgi:hypothetical protein
LIHPPPDALVQACNRAVVLAFARAVTVITRVALPIRSRSGSACPCTADVVAAELVTAGRGAEVVRLGVGVAALVLVDGRGVGVGDGAADVLDVDGGTLRRTGDAARVIGAWRDTVVAERVAPAARLMGRNAGRAG